MKQRKQQRKFKARQARKHPAKAGRKKPVMRAG
jgi:hypothetical protein